MEGVNLRKIAFIMLIIVLVVIPAIGLGCQEEEPEPTETPLSSNMSLASTLVPDMDFDIYVYISQDGPTPVLKDIIGSTFDISVDSLSVWGIAAEESYALSGGLKFTSPAEAADIHGRISEQTGIWTLLLQETIYFTHGSGAPVDNFKSTISGNRFRNYDNEEAMSELALYPDNEAMQLIGVAVASPSPVLVRVIAKHAVPEASGLLDLLLETANLNVVTAGLYSQQQIDVAAIVENPQLANILALETGILASIKSDWPGLLVEPIVRAALENAGYTETVLGELTVYQGYLELGIGMSIPVFFRVEDNRLYAAVSLQESYAEVLISNVGNLSD